MEGMESYIEAALAKAVFEELEDGEGFCATIPGFQGVLAFTETREGLEEELRSVLEGWIDLGLKLGHGLPPVPKSSEKPVLSAV